MAIPGTTGDPNDPNNPQFPTDWFAQNAPPSPATTTAANPHPGYDANGFALDGSGKRDPNFGPNGYTDLSDADLEKVAGGKPAGLPALNGRVTDPAVIKQYVAKWAAMPGADPSLGANPDYWVGRIVDTGGLGNDNTQYWQNAGVGPTAFFNNPNRESGTTSLSNAPQAPTPQTVTLPTQAQVEATPGFQFARDQGLQAIDRNKAASGTYLSGGADKDRATFATGLADQYYQNAVGNTLGIAGFNNSAASNQFGQNLGAQNQYWNQGFNENQNAFNQYNTNQQQAFLQWLALANLGNPGNPYA